MNAHMHTHICTHIRPYCIGRRSLLCKKMTAFGGKVWKPSENVWKKRACTFLATSLTVHSTSLTWTNWGYVVLIQNFSRIVLILCYRVQFRYSFYWCQVVYWELSDSSKLFVWIDQPTEILQWKPLRCRKTN